MKQTLDRVKRWWSSNKVKTVALLASLFAAVLGYDYMVQKEPEPTQTPVVENGALSSTSSSVYTQ